MKRSTVILLLFGIIAVASFLRLYHITSTPPGLYPDEAMDGNNALEIVHGGPFRTFYPEDNGREGLYVNILVFFIQWFGNHPWVVRLPAAIAGILTVIGMYFLVAELFGEGEGSGDVGQGTWDREPVARDKGQGTGIMGRGTGNQEPGTGSWELGAGSWDKRDEPLIHVPLAMSQAIALLSAFLLATSFWHINFSRIGFRAILAPLCLTWALYFLLKAVGRGTRDKERETRDKDKGTWIRGYGIWDRDFFFLLLAGICYGAGFYTYIAYRITPLLFLLFIPFFRRYPGFWKKMLLFLAVTFVVALPIGIYFLQHPGDFFGRTAEISVTNSGNPVGHFAANALKTLAMFNIQGDGNWRHNIAGAPELWWPVGIMFLVGVLWSIYYLWRWVRRGNEGHGTWDMDKEGTRDMGHGTWIKRQGIGDMGQGTRIKEPLLLAPWALLLLFSWFLLALLPAAASDEGIPHALRSILMLPPAIVFAAVGGVWLYRAICDMLHATWGWGQGTRDMGHGTWIKNLVRILAIVFILFAALNAFATYFVTWAENPNVAGAFNADYVAIGNQINALPQSEAKYVVVLAGGVLARGVPVPAETVMFVTDSFTTSTQMENHITYLLPDEIGKIPAGAPTSSVFYLK